MAKVLRIAASIAVAWLLLAAAVPLTVDAARPPKSERLDAAYSYARFLADTGKPAPADATEYAMREAAFKASLHAVLSHNADPSATYRQGLNRFSDWTAEEKAATLMSTARPQFIAMHDSTPKRPKMVTGREEKRRNPRHFGAKQRVNSPVPNATTSVPNMTTTPPPITAMPTAPPPPATTTPAPSTRRPIRPSLDYRAAVPRVLTDVKDQGQCGSCWAHSTVETVETHIAIRSGDLLTLSTQQIVSCVPPLVVPLPAPYNFTDVMHGCHGYIPAAAMAYVAAAQNGSFSQEWEIPYESYWDQMPNTTAQYKPTPACMNDKGRNLVSSHKDKLTGSASVESNSAEAFERTLFEKGPISIVMYVTDSFFRYEGGIFIDLLCEGNANMQPSHAVQLVGWGHDESWDMDYWIVRNSWSPLWGEQGYVRMLKSEPAKCGKMMLPVSGNFTNWQVQEACGPCGILSFGAIPTFA